MEIALPETSQLRERTGREIQRAKKFLIKDQKSYLSATDFLKGLKALEKEIKETFKEPKQKAMETHRAIVAAENKHLEPIGEAERIIKPKIATYLDEQERKRREEERRLQEEARKKAEEETAGQAAQLVEEGQTEEAEALMSQPVEAPPIVVPKATPKVGGITTTEVWHFLILNEALIPREYLTADEKKIGQVVRATKGALKIPGIEVWSEKTVRAGSR